MEIPEDFKVPKILYKYRDWGDAFHKKLILDPSIYLSAPSDFEDKMDCKNPIRYDLLTDYEIFNHFYQESKKRNPDLHFQQHFERAHSWSLSSPLRYKNQVKQIEKQFAEEFNARFGVFSMTGDPLNLKMWNKYSNSLKGFCIGYDSKILFDFVGGGGPVIYVDTLPIIKPFEDQEVEHAYQVFYKEKKWEFEYEYRTHKFWPKRVSQEIRNIVISKECIKEVVIGPEMPNEYREEIERIVMKDLPYVKILYPKPNQSCLTF